MNVAGFLQAIASLSWLAFIVVLILSIVRASRNRPMRGIAAALLALAVVAVVLTTVSAGLVFVQPDQRGVVISAVAPKGYREAILQPGLRWIIPYLENVVFYPISRRAYTMSIATNEGQITGDDSVAARTADGQEIYIDASVIYAVNPEKVIQVHIDWQSRYQDELVRPQARGIVRDAVSQYRVDEVVTTRRSEMATVMRDAMSDKLTENGLILIDFVLRNITFSPEYAASVEQKQIAEQLAQQARFVVEQRKQEAEQARQVAQGQADAAVIRAEGEAQARIIQAEAEAEALRLLAAALKENPDLLTYQYINQLAPGIQVMLVPNDNPFLLPLPSLTPAPTTQPESQLPATP
jgi:regulator of protease activity HflC (stomatin/prohibitin superfamily)